MAITFELAADEDAGLAFGASPLLESVLSLHVLVEPKHHALQHEWVRAMRGVHPALKREIAALSFIYRWTLPNCFLPLPASGDEDFETEIARLRKLQPELAAFELLRPLYDHGGVLRGRRRILRDSDIRAVALKQAGTIGKGAQNAAALVFDDPRRLLDRLARMLEAYWEQAFADEWRRLEPKLADGIAAAGRKIVRDGVYRFLIELAPALRVDPGAQTFTVDVPHDHRVVLGADNPLLLVPSTYVWPHVRVNCDRPWPVALVYRAPYLVDTMRSTSTPRLVQSLRALAAPARLRILRLVAQRPRSTQELASLVALSEAGVSKHLRLLASAGLLTRRREGYYVVYALAPEGLETLASALQHLAADEHRRTRRVTDAGHAGATATDDRS